jgi:predicted dehydrogenase
MHSRAPKAEVEDSGVALLRFESGLCLFIEVGFSLLHDKDFTYFNIFGDKGAALLNPVQIHKELHGQLVEVTPKLWGRNFYSRSFQLQIDSFIASILRQPDPGRSN